MTFREATVQSNSTNQALDLFGDSSNTRVCNTCKLALPVEDFYLHKQGRTIHRVKMCKACALKRRAEKYVTEEGQRAWKAAFLKNTYGITLADYERRLNAQGGVCDLCGCAETRLVKRTKQPQLLCVDHCHTTGAVRGLLCHNCNAGLGRFKDDPERLQLAISYLEKHQNRST